MSGGVSYPGRIYNVSNQSVSPCHLKISSVYALADNNEARNINHLYLPVLGLYSAKTPQKLDYCDGLLPYKAPRHNASNRVTNDCRKKMTASC